MDLNAAIPQVIGFTLLAGIGGIFLTQIFWLSRHIRELWITRRKKPSARSSFVGRAPDLSTQDKTFRRRG